MWPLARPGQSLCYRCRYWVWEIETTKDEKDPWVSVYKCGAEIKGEPGDHVAECNSFERPKLK
jgi:hypothetical protein